MNNLALELVEYVKNDVDQNVELKDLYKSLMYALTDDNYLATLPFDQQTVDEAWDICYARVTLLDPPSPHYYDDVIPDNLLQVEGIKEYFSSLVVDEIEKNIYKVFTDNCENIESDAIESVIETITK